MKTYVTDSLPSNLQDFISSYSKIYQAALVETVNHRLDTPDGEKSKLNTALQSTYQINKRQANAIIAEADGMIASARECRANHIKQLEGKLKSATDWLKKKSKQLKDSLKFYHHKKWQSKKAAPKLRFSSSLEPCNMAALPDSPVNPCTQPITYLGGRQGRPRTTWQCLRFQIHNKKRYIGHLERKITHLKAAPIRVKIPKERHAYFVGSKGELFGNQVCQLDGHSIRIRVPYALEHLYGEYVTAEISSFPYGAEQIQQALSTPGESVSKSGVRTPIEYGVAMTYRFYYKDFRWFMAVSFELPVPKKVTKSRDYGCIGIDLNPDSIGWAYVDGDGNLQAAGQIKLHLGGKRRGQARAIIGDAVKELTILADTYACPIVCVSAAVPLRDVSRLQPEAGNTKGAWQDGGLKCGNPFPHRPPQVCENAVKFCL